MITDSSRVPLGARAWIGDGTHGALVAADGTIDWYSPAGLAGPPVLWGLLDPSGGALRVGPVRTGAGAARRLPAGHQGYRPGTNVVETVLDGGGGRRLSVRDFLPWSGPGASTDGRVVRVVRALSGPVDVEVEVVPAGAFRPPHEVVASAEGLVVDGVMFRAGLPFEAAPLHRDRPRWRATTRLEPGEGFVVSVERREAPPAASLDAALGLAGRTEAAWRSWVAPVAYDGPYREAVQRSLLAVRCLTGPGGAPVAAGTTSLPRRAGGERTADDRSVRWRDAAAAARILASVGMADDAEAAEAWLRRAASAAPLPWPPALDPDGQPVPAREELGLAGWRASQPVVVGRPEGVVDIDLYGDVAAAIGASGAATRSGTATGGASGSGTAGGAAGGAGGAGALTPLSAAWPALRAAADWIAAHWAEPDAGVWESGGPGARPPDVARRPALLVASRVQAWFALDRLARVARAANPFDLDAAAWHEEARGILAWLESDGLAFDGGLRRDGAPSAGDEPDAALLRVAWRGPWPAGHPIVRASVDRVLDRLGAGPLLYRYPEQVDDGWAGPDSPDLLASLWAVRALASLERWDEAHERMEAVVGLGGGLGLLSEAADPVSAELLGNLPSAGAHLAVIDAAVALAAGPA